MARLYELKPAEKIFIVGDLHGDLKTFKQIVSFWQNEENSCLVFLGDYADRGTQGLEIIEWLMKKQDKVVALKGNHEDYRPSGEPKFYPCNLISEVESKRGNWNSFFSQRFKPFLSSLYLAALLPNSILLLHGGLSSKIKTVDDLKNPTPEIEEDILWSDPTDVPGERFNSRGAGIEFGPDITEKVAENLNIKIIIRSHQPNLALNGPCFHHNGKIATISSTRVYGGRPHYLEIDADEIPKILENPRELINCTKYVE